MVLSTLPSAYLILFGLYHSALSVAHDVKLRQLVRRSLEKDSSIGNAQMMQELENKILDITKKNSDILEEKSGEEPSMTNEEIRNCIHYVMNEYGKKEKSFSREIEAKITNKCFLASGCLHFYFCGRIEG